MGEQLPGTRRRDDCRAMVRSASLLTSLCPVACPLSLLTSCARYEILAELTGEWMDGSWCRSLAGAAGWVTKVLPLP